MLLTLCESTLYYRDIALGYVSRPVGFKTDISKWAASVTPRGPPTSISTTSRSHNAATSAKSTALTSSQSVSNTKKQKQKEPVLEPLDDDLDHLGISDDNEEDLARERQSFANTTTRAAALLDVVDIESSDSDESDVSLPRPFTQKPTEHRASLKRRHSESPDDEDDNDDLQLVQDINEEDPPVAEDIDDNDELKALLEQFEGNGYIEEELQPSLKHYFKEPGLYKNLALDRPKVDPAPKTTSRTTDMGDVDIQTPKRLKKDPGDADVIKIEDDSEPVKGTAGESKRKRTSKKHSKDKLPSHAHDDDLWRKVFLPTFLAWLGLQKEVWGPSNQKLLKAIREVWRAVYDEDLPQEQNTINGAVFALCKQRANDWRSSMGSTAIAVLATSFAEQGMYGDEDAESRRAEYASGLLAKHAFMYENVPEDGSAPSGNFRGPLYAITLATHRSAIRSRVKIPEHEKDKEYIPRGAMTLACAAAERACQLAADGALGDIEPVVGGVAAHKASGNQGSPVNKAKLLLQAHSKTRKQVNERTGKTSNTLANFSEANWKWATDLYWRSIFSMKDKYLSDVFKATERHARNLRKGEDDEDDEDEDEDEEMADIQALDDPRAKLPEN